MGYRIEKGEGLAAAFGRIAGEEINLAASALNRPNSGEAVHDARKALKRLRALLRSLRVAMPREFFRAENRRIATAGRAISPLRDVHVQLRALDKLRADGPAARRIRGRLLRRQEKVNREIPALRETVRAMLDFSRKTLGCGPLGNASSEKLAASLKRIYKQGRQAAKKAGASPTATNLHEWRKKVKQLCYGLELIQKVGPGKISRMMKRSEELGDSLGDDHDLFLVLTALTSEHAARPSRDFKTLAANISRKRAKLQKRAFKCGDKLYAEKPAEFERFLDRYFRRANL